MRIASYIHFVAFRSVLNIGEMAEVLTQSRTRILTHFLISLFNYSGSYENLENIHMLTGNNGDPVIMDNLKWYFLLIDDPEAAPVGTPLHRAQFLFTHSLPYSLVQAGKQSNTERLCRVILMKKRNINGGQCACLVTGNLRVMTCQYIPIPGTHLNLTHHMSGGLANGP